MKRYLVRAVASTVLALFFVGTVGASGLPPFTTTPKSSAAGGGRQAELFALAVGCHATFDRIVVHTRFATPGYSVRYVKKIIEPSGSPASLQGSALIQVDIRPARGHTTGGTPLLATALTSHCASLRQIKKAEDFEGVVVLGLGISSKEGFRVFRLKKPSRIVIDILH